MSIKSLSAMTEGVLFQDPLPGGSPYRQPFLVVVEQILISLDRFVGRIHHDQLQLWLEPFFDTQIGIGDNAGAQRAQLKGTG